jgi:hypothetical protein
LPKKSLKNADVEGTVFNSTRYKAGREREGERDSGKAIRKQMKGTRKYHDDPPFKIRTDQPTTGHVEVSPNPRRPPSVPEVITQSFCSAFG